MPDNMHADWGETDLQQYLVGRNESRAEAPVSLSEVLETLKADSRVRVVEVQGPADDPRLLVVLLQPERAEQLKEQYQGKLIVEPNAPLHPLRG